MLLISHMWSEISTLMELVDYPINENIDNKLHEWNEIKIDSFILLLSY